MGLYFKTSRGCQDTVSSDKFKEGSKPQRTFGGDSWGLTKDPQGLELVALMGRLNNSRKPIVEVVGLEVSPTAVCIIQGAPNFDSKIKSQSHEHYISLNSA